jgi:hypothetical protein
MKPVMISQCCASCEHCFRAYRNFDLVCRHEAGDDPLDLSPITQPFYVCDAWELAGKLEDEVDDLTAEAAEAREFSS